MWVNLKSLLISPILAFKTSASKHIIALKNYFVQVFCTCMCIIYMPGACGVKNRLLDPLELELPLAERLGH